MTQMFVLFEHAAGYGLFRVKEFEDVGSFLPQVEQSVTDLGRFNGVVKLVSFSPFKSAAHALDNINSISEGVLSEDLNLFLETNLPKPGKKGESYVLGVSEPKLGAAITEGLGIQCQHTGAVPEIVRGIRLHFASLVKGFSPQTSGIAQLGLGHSYSRAKVKFNVHRVDNMIIQSISLLDQLDKDINTFAMRIREWYSYHFPELVKIVGDNYLFARCAQFIKNRKELTDESVPQLEEIVKDAGIAQSILDAARSSMGMDISPIDLINIERFAKRVVALSEYRKELQEYLKSKMHHIAPNLSALIGEQVGARLISHAGSLTNLAKYPASTVQILGAEKALFRALKTKGNTPKYGLIYHSSFIGRAGTKNKGRISRYLANKCSIASRIDCFAEDTCEVFGNKLREQVEERLKFYESGDIPRKNIDVMHEALEEAKTVMASQKKSKKKKKKSISTAEPLDDTLNASLPANGTDGEGETKKKKKKKCKAADAADAAAQPMNVSQTTVGVEEEGKKKKKKGTDSAAESDAMDTSLAVSDGEGKKKKKKKDKNGNESIVEENANGEENGLPKRKKAVESELDQSAMDDEGVSPAKKSKKKKKKNVE